MEEQKDHGKLLIWVGFILCFFVFAYFFAVTFLNIPASNDKTANIIVGYCSGVISCICGYWFGGAYAPKPIGVKKNEETGKTELEYDYTDVEPNNRQDVVDDVEE